jgi:type IV secretion system protein VirD4
MGGIIKAGLGLLIFVVFWVAFLDAFGIDLWPLLKPLADVIFALALLGLVVLGSWLLYKAGSATLKPPVRQNAGHYLIGTVLVVFFLDGIITPYTGWLAGLLLALLAVALGFYSAAPFLARLGIERWEREQRDGQTSALYGKARFIVFDGDLDLKLFSRLHHPLGSGPFLGFYQANLLPTFFHRLLAWTQNVREVLKSGFQSIRLHPLVYDGPSHLLTIAPARSGKGSCVIIQNLLLLNRSVICVDPKGENAAVTKRQRATFGPVYLLNPFNEHGMGTHRFNPLAGLDIHDPNVVSEVAGIAEALIISEAKEPFFADSARDLVRAIMLHLVATKGSNATLPEMRRLLMLPQGDGENDKFGMLIWEMMQSPYPFISQPASRFQHVDRTVQSVISTAAAQTAFLETPPIADALSANDFDMQDFKKGVITLYIILPSNQLARYARFFRLIVVSALDQLTATPGGQKVTMLLDEFAQLGHLSAIETAFGLAAGYNVQLWPFLQDLNQLKDIYKTRWETFMANAGVIQWFAPNDMTTAEYLSRRLGNKTAITTSVSTGGLWAKIGSGSGSNTSKGETGVPLQTPQDVMAMDTTVHGEFFADTKTQILNVAGIELPIRCMRAAYDARIFKMYFNTNDTAYKELPAFYTRNWQPLFDPNPFHPD